MLHPAAQVDDPLAMATPPHLECFAPRCQYLTLEGVPTWELVLELLQLHRQDAHNHAQEEQIVLKFTECPYTTPDCQDLWTANSSLQSHRNRANHAAPVCQVKDSEDDVAQKEVVIKCAKDISTTEVAKEAATQPVPLLHKPEQDQDPIDSQVSTNVDRPGSL